MNHDMRIEFPFTLGSLLLAMAAIMAAVLITKMTLSDHAMELRRLAAKREYMAKHPTDVVGNVIILGAACVGGHGKIVIVTGSNNISPHGEQYCCVLTSGLWPEGAYCHPLDGSEWDRGRYVWPGKVAKWGPFRGIRTMKSGRDPRLQSPQGRTTMTIAKMIAAFLKMESTLSRLTEKAVANLRGRGIEPGTREVLEEVFLLQVQVRADLENEGSAAHAELKKMFAKVGIEVKETS